MKRTLTITTAAIAALVLSGCGGSPNAQPTPEPTVTETVIVTESPTPAPTVTETDVVTPTPAPDPVTDVSLVIPDCPRLNPVLDTWATDGGGSMNPLDASDVDMLKNLGPAAQEAIQNARQVGGCEYINGPDGASDARSAWQFVIELSHGDMTDFRTALKSSGYDESIIDDALRYSDGTNNFLVCGNAWIILSDDNADWERSAIDTLVDANPGIAT